MNRWSLCQVKLITSMTQKSNKESLETAAFQLIAWSSSSKGLHCEGNKGEISKWNKNKMPFQDLVK